MRLPREDLRVPDAEADLYLVGLGIGGFARRTVEADAVLGDSSLILHLTAFDHELRSAYPGDVLDLAGMYEADEDPSRVYAGMADTVLRSAASYRQHGPVSFVVYGHPLCLVDSAWTVLREAPRQGLRAKPVAGTSYLDQLLCDVGLRFDAAAQVFEANLFVEHDVRPDPRFPLVLSQVGDFGSDRLRPSGDRVARLAPLIERLRSLYPPARRAAVVMSAWRSDMAPAMTVTTVAELGAAVSSAHVGVSLVVEGEPAWARFGTW